MNRRSILRKLFGIGAASCCSRLFGGDPGPDQGGSNYTIRSDVRLVLLDVSVTDAKGAAVPGLVKDGFQVIEDGRPQTITVFDNQDIPVTIGLLVDESRSMTPKRGAVLLAAEVFIQESNPQDQMFVLNFNDRVRKGLPADQLFSGDRLALRDALYRGNAEGRTALYDAVIAGLEQLEEARREKKALVVISDGGDTASMHTRKEMLNAVEGSVATIYAVGLFDADDPDRDPGILKHLAAISGGRVYFPSDASRTIPICRAIAREIRSRYTIGYVPQAESGGHPLRHVEVRVSAPGHSKLHARTRTSYRY